MQVQQKKKRNKKQKQRKDRWRESLPLVYWTHCIPDSFCKEKLVIKKVSSFSNSVRLIEGPESRCLIELLRGRAQHPRTLRGSFLLLLLFWFLLCRCSLSAVLLPSSQPMQAQTECLLVVHLSGGSCRSFSLFCR